MALVKGKKLVEFLLIKVLDHQEDLKEVYDKPTKQLESVPLREEGPSKVIHIGTMLTSNL